MDRALPEFNRILHKKWTDQNKRIYKQRLHESKPLIDNNEPSAVRYPLIKLKKEQLLEERCTEIERANRILLEKMTSIMAHPQNQYALRHLSKNRQIQSGVSNQYSACGLNAETLKQRDKSLNKGIRQREIDRITQENEQILKRLQEKTSTYNVGEWELDRKKQIKILKKICYYPPSLLRKSRRNRTKNYGGGNQDPNSEVYSFYQQNLKQSVNDMNNNNSNQKFNQSANDIQISQQQNQQDLSNVYQQAVQSEHEFIQTYNQEGFYSNQNFYQENSTDVAQSALLQSAEKNVLSADAMQQLEGTERNAANQEMQLNGMIGPSFNQPRLKTTDGGGNNFVQIPVLISTQQRGGAVGSGINLIAKKRPPPMNIGFNEEGIDQTRQVLYRNFHQIEQQVFLVEISRNLRKIFIIVFPNFENPAIHQYCILAEKQAQKLMSESGNMFEEFVKRLYIKYGKLQIQGFHSQNLRINRSVSPTKRQMMNLFNINNRADSMKNKLKKINESVKEEKNYKDQDLNKTAVGEKLEYTFQNPLEMRSTHHTAFIKGQELKEEEEEENMQKQGSQEEKQMQLKKIEDNEKAQQQFEKESQQQSIKTNQRSEQKLKTNEGASGYALPADETLHKDSVAKENNKSASSKKGYNFPADSSDNQNTMQVNKEQEEESQQQQQNEDTYQQEEDYNQEEYYNNEDDQEEGQQEDDEYYNEQNNNQEEKSSQEY